MKLNKLLDMKLRDVLDEYCAVYNPECGYYYGVFRWDDVFQCYEEYNIDKDYPEAVAPENLITDEVIINFDEEEVRGYDVLERMMDNLGISKKNEKDRNEEEKV